MNKRKEQRKADALVRQAAYDAKPLSEKLKGAGKRQTDKLLAKASQVGA